MSDQGDELHESSDEASLLLAALAHLFSTDVIDRAINDAQEQLASAHRVANAEIRRIVQEQIPDCPFEPVYADPENQRLIDRFKRERVGSTIERLESLLSVLCDLREMKSSPNPHRRILRYLGYGNVVQFSNTDDRTSWLCPLPDSRNIREMSTDEWRPLYNASASLSVLFEILNMIVMDTPHSFRAKDVSDEHVRADMLNSATIAARDALAVMSPSAIRRMARD
jgi:hypothetical protein